MNHQEELRKCKESFIYFAENYVKLYHWRNGLVPFNLYPYQKRLVYTLLHNRFVCGVKFRQGGFTTVQVMLGLWECMFKENQHVMVTTRSDRCAIDISYVVRRAINELPDWMKPELSRDNDHTKAFSATGSSMVFLCFEPAPGRSATRLIIDEAASISNARRDWRCLFPCIHNDGKCSVISTPNGANDWFHDIVRDAEGVNSFVLFECNHREHPEYWTTEWEATQRTNLGDLGYMQEVLGEFLGQTTVHAHEMKKKWHAVQPKLDWRLCGF